MSTIELRLDDRPASAVDPVAVWTKRSWQVAGTILADVLTGIVAALTNHNPVFIVALVALLPLGIVLHWVLTQVERLDLS
jgi:hypothetical protein